VMGGLIGSGCGALVPASSVLLIEPGQRASRDTSWPDGRYPSGAAATALSSGGFLVAGGEGEVTARTDVQLVDVNSNPARISLVGQLDRPRAHASALAISSRRVLFAGGQSATSTRTLLRGASAFDSSTGRTVASSEVFADGRADMAHARLASGALVFAGGRSATGASAHVVSVAVDPDGSGAVEAAEPIGELARAGTGRLLDLRDGSLLFVPDDPRHDLTWIGTLPREARAVERPEDSVGRLLGDVISPGLAVLHGDDGSLWTFHSGTRGVANRVAPSIEAPPVAGASGLVPSDPSSVRFEDGAIVVEGPEFFGLDLLPEQLVLLTPASITDFELTVDYRTLAPQSRPSIAYGVSDGEYDHLVLQSSPQVVRSPLRRGTGRAACDPISLPELSELGPHRVRVARSRGGRRLTLDVGVDGREELRCEIPVPRAGGIALGVASGRVAFDRVGLRVR